MGDRAAQSTTDSRPRILLVTPASPFPADSGGAQRTALLHEALACDFLVDLYLVEPVDAAVRVTLTRDFGLVGEAPRPSLPRRLLRDLADKVSAQLRAIIPNRKLAAAIASQVKRKKYLAVILRYSATACQLPGLGRRCPGTKIYVDVDDFLSQLLRPADTGAAPRGWLGRLCARLAVPWIEEREREALCGTDGLWINGWRPAWLHAADGLRTAPLPNIPFHDPVASKATQADGRDPVDYLGVAQFLDPPNYEGFDWFLKRVWPLIRASAPETRLRLVGTLPPSHHLHAWRAIPGVELTGRVENVAAEYGHAKVAIAPIPRGGGTKIKVLEAQAMGLPCVCTLHAALGLDDLSGLLVTDNPAKFAQHCLDLRADEPGRTRLGARGRSDVERSHSRAHFLAGVRRLMGSGGL